MGMGARCMQAPNVAPGEDPVMMLGLAGVHGIVGPQVTAHPTGRMRTYTIIAIEHRADVTNDIPMRTSRHRPKQRACGWPRS